MRVAVDESPKIFRGPSRGAMWFRSKEGPIEAGRVELEPSELESQVLARFSDDVVWYVEEEEEVGRACVEVVACIVEDREVFIPEDEVGFFME